MKRLLLTDGGNHQLCMLATWKVLTISLSSKKIAFIFSLFILYMNSNIIHEIKANLKFKYGHFYFSNMVY